MRHRVGSNDMTSSGKGSDLVPVHHEPIVLPQWMNIKLPLNRTDELFQLVADQRGTQPGRA